MQTTIRTTPNLNRRRTTPSRRGIGLVYGIMTMTVVIGFGAFSIDLSRARTAKSELQAASDAAALNGANGLSTNTYIAKAQAAALENHCDGTAVSIPTANITPGNWTGSAFVANGSPSNAIRVVASRTKSSGTGLTSTLAQALGWTMPDVSATSVVAITKQAPYEWVGKDSVNLTGTPSTAMKVTAFDATNGAAAESLTTVKSNGSVVTSSKVALNGDVRYGTSSSISAQTTVAGSVQQNASALTYPPGSQVANINGATPVYAATTDLTVNSSMSLPGGLYIVKNCNVNNCNITFTGPATIVLTGNFTASSMSFTTYNGLPANLKVIATNPGTTINITNPTATLNADFYAPDSPFTFSSASGYFGMRGRGVFKSMDVSGAGSSLWYDRSLTASSQSMKALLVR